MKKIAVLPGDGIGPEVVAEAVKVLERLFRETAATPGYRLTIDLAAQAVTTPDGTAFRFDIDAFRKKRLLEGLDDIGLTLQHVDEIRAYEARRRREAPWLFS